MASTRTPSFVGQASSNQGAALFRALFHMAIPAVAGLAIVLAGQASLAPAADEAVTVPPPAFYTGAVSRASNIVGDTFDFKRSDGKSIKIRLADADCQAAADDARDQAKFVASDLLEEAPFWVFPCGKAKGEIYAYVWTAKGWLGDLLVKANYGQRRADLDAITFDPVEAAGFDHSGPPPAAPAFAATSCTAAADADVFEVERDGRKFSIRLADCSSADVDASGAKSTAARVLGKPPIWVFPNGPLRGGKDPVTARIWTAEGWLSDILIKAGQAKRTVAVAKAPASGLTPATPAAKADPAAKKAPTPAKPSKSDIEWKEIPCTLSPAKAGTAAAYSMAYTGMTSMTALSLESDVFKIEGRKWRLQWELKPARTGVPAMMNIYRVDDQWQTKISSTHMGGFNQPTGAQVFNTPGNFWIRVSGSMESMVKVEEAVPAAK